MAPLVRTGGSRHTGLAAPPHRNIQGIFMARKKDSPQKAAMREMMRDYLKNNDISIKDGTDVNSIMRDMMSVILEGALDEELDEELGYSKYDYQ